MRGEKLKKFDLEEIRNELGGTKVHSIIVQKGGTGKSTTTSSIAYVMAKLGLKVLVIDSDPQASLSGLCGILPTDYLNDSDTFTLASIYEYMIECISEGRGINYQAIKPVILHPTYVTKTRSINENGKIEWVDTKEDFGFDLIPSDIDLAGIELQLVGNHRIPNSGLLLYMLCEIIKEKEDYDYILIDCPPGLGILGTNDIAASVDGCIIPINLEIMTLRGARNIIEAVGQTQELLKAKGKNHKGVFAILKNQFLARSVVQKNFNEVVDEFFPIPAFDTTIPNKSSCNKAHSAGQLFSQFDASVFEVFKELTYEILMEDIRRRDESDSPISEIHVDIDQLGGN